MEKVKIDQTPVALYRKGNASSPRMDHVRPRDITVYEEQGESWVMPISKGLRLPAGDSQLEGISTLVDTPESRKNWWKLDPGTDIPPELELVKDDRPGHWLFSPSKRMTLVQYQKVLRRIGKLFSKLE